MADLGIHNVRIENIPHQEQIIHEEKYTGGLRRQWVVNPGRHTMHNTTATRAS